MILTGLARLGRDAEVRFTQGGDAVAGLALAFNYGKKEGDSRPTQWIEASLWGKRAEALAPYLTKGSALDVVLQDPHIETYDKKDGSQGFKLVARVLEIELAGGSGHKTESSGHKPASSGDYAKASGSTRPAAPKPTAPAGSFNDLEDDIPF